MNRIITNGIQTHIHISRSHNYTRFLTYCTFFFLSLSQPKACSEAALSLLSCMEETPCMKDNNNNQTKTLLQCMQDEKEAEPCKAERNAYYLCKHSQLNMRTRIRGTRAY